MKSTKPTDRRNFLLAAGLGGAGVAAAVAAAGAKVSPPRADEAAPDPKATAYRASAHVLKYYKTTEV
jgi:hypothetical protein